MLRDSGSNRFRILMISFVLFLVLVGWFTFTLIQNAELKDLERSRDLRLAPYEVMKFWVYDDIRNFLLISSESDYNKLKSSLRFSDNLKYELMGSEYNSLRFGSISQVNLVDGQYTLGDEDGVTFYFLLEVVTSSKKGYLDVLAFVKDDKITKLLAY